MPNLPSWPEAALCCLSGLPRLLGRCPITVTPGTAPPRARVHILHKSNQALKNPKCCWFLEKRLKPGCVFWVSKHNVNFGLVSLDFEQVLGALRAAVSQSGISECLGATSGFWKLRGLSQHHFQCQCLALTCFPPCCACFGSSITQTLIKMLSSVAICCQVIVFCYLPFPPLLICDSFLQLFIF